MGLSAAGAIRRGVTIGPKLEMIRTATCRRPGAEHEGGKHGSRAAAWRRVGPRGPPAPRLARERPVTPQECAARSAAAMWEGDAATRWAGIALDSVAPGEATVSMLVSESHVNGHGICHGGLIFTLADTAFAYACNSYNRLAVAHTCSVTFLRPGRLGDRLVATAREVGISGRSGVYDVTVCAPSGEPVAEFRGLSRVIDGRHFEETS